MRQFVLTMEDARKTVYYPLPVWAEIVVNNNQTGICVRCYIFRHHPGRNVTCLDKEADAPAVKL